MKKLLLSFVFIATIAFIPSASQAQHILSAAPVAEFTQNKTQICLIDSVTFTNASTGTVTSYQWDFGTDATPATSISASPKSVHYSSSGTKTITLTVAGPGGTGNVSHTVTVNTFPTVAVTPANGTICSGSSQAFTATGASTYKWSPATGLNNTTNSTIIASPTVNTTYTVVGTDANGCSANSSATVTLLNKPIIKVTPSPTRVCLGGSQDLTASGALTYTWDPSTSLSNSTGTTVKATPSVSTTYTVVGTDANGCTGSTTVPFTVITPPKIIVTPANSQICTGGNKKLTASGALTYAWSPSADLSSSSGTTVTATPTANSTYTVVGTDIYGCTGTTNAAITVNPIPTITAIATSTDICRGISSTITASGGATYSWSPSKGLNQTSGSTVIATPTSSITYIVTGTNASGCSSTSSVSINVTPYPKVTVTPASAQICIGDKTTLTADGATTYTWYPSDSLKAAGNAAVIATPTVSITYTVVGTTNGCKDSTQVRVIVNQLPTSTFSITRKTLCTYESETISYTGNAATSASYTWDFTGATITSGSGQGPFNVNWGTSGQKFITLNVIESGCNSTLGNDSVIINKITKATAGADQVICGNATKLAGNKVAPPEKGTWAKVSGSGVINNPGNANSNVGGLGSGNNVFSWTISNAGCFPTTDFVTISTVDTPTVADAGPTQIICSNKTTLTGNRPKFGTGKWSLINGGAIIVSDTMPKSTVTGLINGITVLKWTISNDPCPASFSTDTIKNCTTNSIIDLLNNQGLKIFPNPTTSSEFNISHSMPINKIEIVDILGKVCFEKTFNPTEIAGTTPVSMNNVASGTYLIKIYTETDVLLKKLQILKDAK